MSRRRRPAARAAFRSGALAALAAALVGLAPACGDAVTNPQLDGFDADPLLIAGRWATLNTSAQGTTRFDAELTPAGGVFLGVFRFFRFGEAFELQFNDGQWNGTRLTFTATTVLNGEVTVAPWEATYRPAEGAEPERLILLSDIVGVPVEYVRPADLPPDFQ